MSAELAQIFTLAHLHGGPPNNDMLCSMSILDLSNEPIILSVPRRTASNCCSASAYGPFVRSAAVRAKMRERSLVG